MYKNKSLKVISAVVSFAMVVSMTSVTSLANDDQIQLPVIADGTEVKGPERVEVTGDVNYEGTAACAVGAVNGGEVSVSGSVNHQEIYDQTQTSYAVVAINNGSGDANKQGGKVTVGNDVISNAGGIRADDGSVVNITGDVEAWKTGIEALDGSKVTVGGKVFGVDQGVNASGKGTAVTVAGDVTSGAVGVWSDDEATVTVGGNICDNKKGIPEGSDSRIIRNGVVVGNDATAIVNGNITTRESGVVIYEGSGTAIVNGDVTADYIGVGMDMSYRNGDYYVVVDGTVKATGKDNDYGYALYFYPPELNPENSDDSEDSEEQDDSDDESEADTDDNAGETVIVVYKLEAKDKDHIVGIGGESLSNEEKAEQIGYILNAINYIIKVHDGDKAGEVEANTHPGLTDQKTIKSSESATVTVKDGYYLKGSEAAVITRNEDGTYTVRLKEGCFGGLDLYILKKTIEDATGETVNVETEGEADPQSIVVTDGSMAAPVVTEDAADAVTPARVVSLNLTEITPAQMKDAIIENIAATPDDGVLRIETDRVSCLDTAMLQAFAEKGNIDIELIFTYNGQKIRVFIPRGTDISSLLDKDGYCGYLNLAKVLGYIIL